MQLFDPLALDLGRVNLIEASAGTGKTYSIATLFVRLLLERQLRIDQILVVTFTRAATAELRDRLRQRLRVVREGLLGGDLGDDQSLRAYVQARRQGPGCARDLRLLDDALRAFDTAAIHTIHAFCQRALQENAFESGARFDATVAEDDRLLEELVHAHWAQRLYGADPLLVRHLRAQRTDLSVLQALARLVSTHRDARLQATLRDDDADAVLAAWRQARTAAQDLWQAQRERIVELLCQPGVLDGRTHKADRIRSVWAPWLDRVLALDSLQGLVDDEGPGSVLQRCTPAVLTHRTSKKATGRTPRHVFFEACQVLVDRTLDAGQALESLRLRLLLELGQRVREELPARKQELGQWAFDDLVYQLRQALRRPGSALTECIRQRFQVALIDEFQDTDPVQYEIFRTLWGGHQGLLLIGDPKQAIYAFRGADVFAYLQAVAHADARWTLPTNHRSDRGLVQAVHALFGRASLPFVFEQIPALAVEARHGSRAQGALAPLELLVASSETGKVIGKGEALRMVARGVATDIVELLQGPVRLGDDDRGWSPVTPGQVAVLCRTNRQADAVQDALRQAGLPSVLQSGASVFDSREALELERLLRAIHGPGDVRAVRSALATRILGLTSSALLALAEDPAAWSAQVARLQGLRETWQRQGVLACLRSAVEQSELMPRWLAELGGERRLTNLLHLGELLQQAAAERHLGPAALLEWLRRLRHDQRARREQVGDSAQLRLESDDDAVQLVTVHRSKGLQYDVVYVPYLWDGKLLRDRDPWWLYHQGEPEPRLVIDLDRDAEGQVPAETEALAESLRLLYVALTRARHLCRSVWGAFNDVGSSALSYLIDGGAAAGQVAAWIAGADGRQKVLANQPDVPLHQLQALLRESQGTIAARLLPTDQAEVARAADGQAPCTLQAASLAREPAPGYRLSSYSSLIAGSERSAPVEEDADLDRVASTAAEDPAPSSGARITLHDLGGGARLGRAVHAALEHSELATVAVEPLLQRLHQELGDDAALDVAAQRALAQALVVALERPLQQVAPGFSLRQVAAARALVELPFQLCVTPQVFVRPRTVQGLLASDLARLFEQHGQSELARRYASVLRGTGIAPPPGFLSGVIDLVFEHGGRWYLVDYKTNFLGPLVDDYAAPGLQRAMLHHHYVLQYHLYAVALDRHLRWRQRCGQPELQGYSLERAFGGVLYLFLRGMCAPAPVDAGVFFDRPAAALLRGLDALLDGREPHTA